MPATRKTHCPQGHPYADFGYVVDRKRGIIRVCRVCQLASQRRYKKRELTKDRDGYLGKRREYRWQFFLRQLGITPEEVSRRFEEQEHRCAICRTADFQRKSLGRVQGYHLDHDHQTNWFRGILCAPCNLAIGMFDDDPRRLVAGANYLYRSKREQSLPRTAKAPMVLHQGQRKAVTVCKHGHSLLPGPNLYINPNTQQRICRACAVIKQRKHRAKMNAEIPQT